MVLQAYRVGDRWPHPLAGEGLQAVMNAGEQGLQLMLVAGVARPTDRERRALAQGSIRIGILPADPLVWFVLSGEGVSLDAPYGLGLTGPARAGQLLVAADCARFWSDRIRGLVTVALVDTASHLTSELRVVSLSKAWWIALADALAAMPKTLSQGAYDRAMVRDYARWTSPEAVLAASSIVEVGGTV
jgi:hypothetical protein